MENIILKQATYYLEMFGWNIIPVTKEKKPYFEWKKYQTQKVTVRELTSWFSDYPEANIAVITGRLSNLTVVDIDPRHNGSYKQFENIQTIKSKTGGNGYHIFFQYEEGLQNKAGIQEGIDIRSEAGYIILPPSIHQSGNSYDWIISPQEGVEPIKLPDFVKDWTKKTSVNGHQISNWDSSVLNGVSEGQGTKKPPQSPESY